MRRRFVCGVLSAAFCCIVWSVAFCLRPIICSVLYEQLPRFIQCRNVSGYQPFPETVHMKRKLCAAPSFNCEDDMEELNVAALSRRKESAAPLTEERETTILHHALKYPLAFVLRLRVLQIVCGISAMVMGSVAFIEERQKFNMGLGIPAGGISVIAAAVSIHTSRGWSAVSSGVGAGAGAASVLWAASACLLLALIVQCCRTIFDPPGVNYSDGPIIDESRPSSRDLVIIACVQISLAAATLLSAAVCARIDCSS